MSGVLASDEVQPIVEKLVLEYPTNLSEIDPSRMIYVRGKGKRRPVTIASVKEPYSLVMSQRFILSVHGPKFDPLSDDKKAIAIFDELLRVKDFEAGKLAPHSVVGNFETLNTWGMDWLEADSLAPVFKPKSDKKQA